MPKRANKVKTEASPKGLNSVTGYYTPFDPKTGNLKEPEEGKKVGGTNWVKQAKKKTGGYAKYQTP